jgi:hypothetical protein
MDNISKAPVFEHHEAFASHQAGAEDFARPSQNID